MESMVHLKNVKKRLQALETVLDETYYGGYEDRFRQLVEDQTEAIVSEMIWLLATYIDDTKEEN